jgi:hypothetical protein
VASVLRRQPNALLRDDKRESASRDRQGSFFGNIDFWGRVTLDAVAHLLDVEALGDDGSIAKAKVVARRLKLLVPKWVDRDFVSVDRLANLRVSHKAQAFSV